MNELTITSRAVEVAGRIKVGLVLDRHQVKKLLREVAGCGANIVGCEVMKSQLAGILQRRDWLLVSISADSPSAARLTGVNIGIVQTKPTTKKNRLSPLQKWQRKNGLDRQAE